MLATDFSRTMWVSAVMGATMVSAIAAEPIDFQLQVRPILESSCLSCHDAEHTKGKLRLDTAAATKSGGENKGAGLVPGKPDDSSIYKSIILPAGHDDIMPPKGDTLTKEQILVLKQWIEQGAAWPADATLHKIRRVEFTKDIKPILEQNCVSCHRADYIKGELRLDEKEPAFKGGENGSGIVPFNPKKSRVFVSTTLTADDDGVMPPAKKGGPMPKEKVQLLQAWIEQGAPWPDGIKLEAKKVEASAGANEAELAKKIHGMVLSKPQVASAAAMERYTNLIPGTKISYSMVTLPAGDILMGSPETEANRNADEGPRIKVQIPPFWMGQYEVTWNQFELFMYPDEEHKFKSEISTDPEVDKISDVVTRPTKPYVEMSFGMGKDGFPAISMTHHAANKFCQWLSAKTGHFYRLPTEAEWEYACRAGSTTAYSFGDDASKIGEYAWYEKNSDFKYQKVGKKKPNAWGLYDMHGNVAEWCLDQYQPTFETLKSLGDMNPYVPSKTAYPHVAKGGSWDDEPKKLRSAARRASDKSWKMQDPQLPKSIWYLTDAQFLGFRIVRPLQVPSAEEMQKYWNNGVERE